MRSINLFLFLITLSTIGRSQDYLLTDSTLTIEILANDGIPDMKLTLGKNFIKAHEEMKQDFPEAKEISYYVIIIAGPAEKYRIDILKIEIDENPIGFEGNLTRMLIISAMYEAELDVSGTLDGRVSYTFPLKFL